jgi:hypothetical protein
MLHGAAAIVRLAGSPPATRMGFSRMQRHHRKKSNLIALAALAPIVVACSSYDSLSNLTIVPRSDIFRPDWATFSGNKEEFTLRPVTAGDLIGPRGECAEGQTSASSAADLGGISLQMTECQVIQRAGPPDNIEFSGSERTERAVVLTYVRGPRPGVYRFSDGRLYSIERAPEPAGSPAPKPAKAAPKKSGRV